MVWSLHPKLRLKGLEPKQCAKLGYWSTVAQHPTVSVHPDKLMGWGGGGKGKVYPIIQLSYHPICYPIILLSYLSSGARLDKPTFWGVH